MVYNSLKGGDTQVHTCTLTTRTNKTKCSKPLASEKGWCMPGLKMTAKSKL